MNPHLMDSPYWDFLQDFDASSAGNALWGGFDAEARAVVKRVG
jgi:hypothetical protein